jgi:hypothetical protein
MKISNEKLPAVSMEENTINNRWSISSIVVHQSDSRDLSILYTNNEVVSRRVAQHTDRINSYLVAWHRATQKHCLCKQTFSIKNVHNSSSLYIGNTDIRESVSKRRQIVCSSVTSLGEFSPIG